MPKLNDYELMLFDVDGTLTGADRLVSQRTQAALKKIVEKGMRIGVCTGRTYSSLSTGIFSYFPEKSIHVTCGGAQVVSKEGKIYWEKLLSHHAVSEIVQRAEEFNAGFLLSHEDKIYVNQKMHDYLAPRKDLRGLEIFSYKELTDYSTPAIPVFAAPLEFFNYLNERNDVNYKIMRTYELRNADITAKGVNKATGLHELSKILNIPTEKIIGVGDSENDDEFLQTVGYSVAMGNATPYLKSIANRTIGHTDEEGLAIYLESIAEGEDI
jgi:Cof subfamily protein (haloacid dehalogenase superfamily)